MTRRSTTFQLFRLLALAIVATGVVAGGIRPSQGEPGDGNELRVRINETVEALWDRSDGPVLRGATDRAWLWGPMPLSTSTEFYPESPSGQRTLVYYAKGRLDILDAGASTANDWYAVGGLLVHEMLAGRIQLGDTFFVERSTPAIPLAGDFGQEQPVTYVTLAPFTSAWQSGPTDGFASGGERRVVDQTGDAVMARLGGDGRLIPNAEPASTVRFGSYDETTGHNIADIFVAWNASQPYPALYLLGHPISEPYWIETVIEGQPSTVLIQAFERRVLTYNPGNPEGWQVESTNVGEHYRAWRGLPEITDPQYMPLAAEVPFGEEIVGAALAHNIDPFMLAAISQAASKGDPRHYASNGGRGLLATNPALHDTPKPAAHFDPAVSADHGARALAFWIPEGVTDFDWRAVLANYYTHGNIDWNDAQLEAFVHAALESYGALKQQYPPLEANQLNQEVWGGVLDRGPAAHYAPSYTADWWERTQQLYARKGVIASVYEPDPNGYYCVRPGYVPGERLRLRANGVTITCTVGDMVADHDLHNWLLVSDWAVELSWSAFTALGLQHSNWVEVDYPGPWAKRTPPIPPPPPVWTPAPEPQAPAPEPPPPVIEAPADPTPPPVSALPAPPAAQPPAEVAQPDPDPTATPEPEPEPPVAGEPTPPPTT